LTLAFKGAMNGDVVENFHFTGFACCKNSRDIILNSSPNRKGQRVKKVTGGNTPIYHYDLLGNLIQETNQSGGVIVSYVYAGMNRLAKIETGGSIYYYHNDHLGTPLAMTDSTGAIVWKAAYDPFGKAEVDPSSTVTNNFRFPGQYYDSESGLHYNWHRYYDPGTGRYMTADYFGLYEFINTYDIYSNPYVYIENTPMNLIDPQGLYEIKPGVPDPSPLLDILLRCMESYLGYIYVTSTTDNHPPDTPHGRGEAIDIRYPSDAKATLCAAAKCGAQYGKDEKIHPSKKSTGPHIHLQITPGIGGGKGDLPSKDCSLCPKP